MTPIRPPTPLRSDNPALLAGSALGPNPLPTRYPRPPLTAPSQSGAPFPVDIYADDQRIYLRAELPGVDPSTIQIQPHADHLTVFACDQPNVTGDCRSAHLFGRQLRLPGCEASTALISTDYALGILTLVLPRPEQAEPRSMSIAIN